MKKSTLLLLGAGLGGYLLYRWSKRPTAAMAGFGTTSDQIAPLALTSSLTYSTIPTAYTSSSYPTTSTAPVPTTVTAAPSVTATQVDSATEYAQKLLSQLELVTRERDVAVAAKVAAEGQLAAAKTAATTAQQQYQMLTTQFQAVQTQAALVPGLQTQLQMVTTQYQTAQQRAGSLQTQLTAMTTAAQQATARFAAATQQYEAAFKQLQTANAALATAEQKIKTLTADLSRVQADLTEAKRIASLPPSCPTCPPLPAPVKCPPIPSCPTCPPCSSPTAPTGTYYEPAQQSVIPATQTTVPLMGPGKICDARGNCADVKDVRGAVNAAMNPQLQQPAASGSLSLLAGAGALAALMFLR